MSNDDEIEHVTEIERVANGKPSHFDMDEAFRVRIMVDYRKRLEEAERPYREAIERDRRETQRRLDELQAWSDRNAERRHREAEERHWRRMENQHHANPIVAALAVYGAYKAYKAFTSDDEEEK